MPAAPPPAFGGTRSALVAGAARAFAEHGVRACTMQAVAAASGVSKATLYNYFRTKDEVVRALVQVEVARLSGLAAALPPDQALAALADEVGEHPVVRRLAAVEPETISLLVDVPTETFAELTAALAEALGTDEDGAGIALRWLVGMMLQPTRSSARHRAAARVAAAVLPG